MENKVNVTKEDVRQLRKSQIFYLLHSWVGRFAILHKALWPVFAFVTPQKTAIKQGHSTSQTFTSLTESFDLLINRNHKFHDTGIP